VTQHIIQIQTEPNRSTRLTDTTLLIDQTNLSPSGPHPALRASAIDGTTQLQ